jgi:3-oxoacyl-[acyl-carrier-protein] synthase III
MDRVGGCGVGIVGLGVYLPPRVVTNEAFEGAAAVVDDILMDGAGPSRHAARWAADPYCGTIERRVMDAEQRSSQMEVEAAREALRSAGVDPGGVDLLIGYSQVPDDLCPGNHGRVARALELPRQATAMTLETGCASFVTQLNTAVRLVQSGDHRLALLYQSSATSRVQDQASRWAAAVGDGAVAEVVGAVPEGYGWIGRAHFTRGELCDGLLVARADRRPDWWAPSEVPFHITSRDGAAVRRMGVEGVAFARETCEEVLRTCGYTASDVDLLVCSQPQVWFGEACAEALGLREGRFVPPEEHFQRFGHLLPASAPLNLWVAWSQGRLRRGDLVLVYSPGVGFTQVASLLRWWMDPPSAC